MSEPTTAAGRALADRLAEPEDYDWGNRIRADILAIEAEAAAATPEALRVALLMELASAIPGSCDWGGCDNDALLARHDAEKGWLPVCQWHAGDASAADLAPITALPLGDAWVLLAALKAGPIYAGPTSPFWATLNQMAREGLCHGEFVPFDGWMWSR